MKTKILITKVAGVTFEGRQEYLKQMTGREPVRIVPEPENPFDKNALAVHVALRPGEIVHAGFIPRDLAAEVAPHLDGEAVMAKIIEITGGFEFSNGSTASLGLLLEIEIPDADSVSEANEADGPLPWDNPFFKDKNASRKLNYDDFDTPNTEFN